MRKMMLFLFALSLLGCTGDRTENHGSDSEPNMRADPLSHVFTYSILETEVSGGPESVETTGIAALAAAGAVPYSAWLPTAIPDSTPFAGLRETQVALMAAWPGPQPQISRLDSTLAAIDGVSSVASRAFLPIYLADGLTVPTGSGFYVHREEQYRVGDVAEAVRLSQEAWETWEPFWGTRVTGLFRENPDSMDVANLLRIVWYPSLDGWTETRDFRRDPESARRFAARAQLQLEGSGVAIATNRGSR